MVEPLKPHEGRCEQTGCAAKDDLVGISETAGVASNSPPGKPVISDPLKLPGFSVRTHVMVTNARRRAGRVRSPKSQLDVSLRLWADLRAARRARTAASEMRPYQSDPVYRLSKRPWRRPRLRANRELESILGSPRQAAYRAACHG
jgi:hypothetical protein